MTHGIPSTGTKVFPGSVQEEGCSPLSEDKEKVEKVGQKHLAKYSIHLSTSAILASSLIAVSACLLSGGNLLVGGVVGAVSLVGFSCLSSQTLADMSKAALISFAAGTVLGGFNIFIGAGSAVIAATATLVSKVATKVLTEVLGRETLTWRENAVKNVVVLIGTGVLMGGLVGYNPSLILSPFISLCRDYLYSDKKRVAPDDANPLYVV